MSGEKTSPFDAKFAQLVKETLDKWHVPGLSIAVVDGDDVWAEVSSETPYNFPVSDQGRRDSTI
jgi:hypothetical protein